VIVAEQGGVEQEFSARYDFPFDDFQLEAMEHIRSGSSVMVAAPTSAGKTVVAEYALWRAVAAGKRAVYTSPIKALSNQKRRELERFFPGNVGLLTGDRSENRDADVVVMTTEVLRNMLLEDPESLAGVAWVVFDEVHYLADRDRGTIWEEAIITCLPHIQLVCLSATIANAEEIAAWISKTHRPIALVRHDERPVPLAHYTFTGEGLKLILDGSGRAARDTPTSSGRRGRRETQNRLNQSVPAVIQALRKAELLPAIWFAFTRKGVEEAALLVAEASPEVHGVQQEAIENAIAHTLAAMPAEDRSLSQISRLMDGLRRGVGFHHAGLVPPCKELGEDLFARGLLSVVCATDTLSVGINMPARTVVISSMSRPVAGMLTPNDFSQLTGRAGRRGIDEQGAVVVLPSAYLDFHRSYAAITGPLEPIKSGFTLRYSTLLSLFGSDGAEHRLAAVVASSLHQFQLYGEARAAEISLAGIEAELLRLAPVDGLQGREQELDEYLEIQRRLTAAEKAERGRTRSHRRHRGDRHEQRDRTSSHVGGLRALLRSHPMHALASRPDFQATASERLELLRRRNRLLRVVEGARRERERDGEQTARAVTAVLTRLDYIRNGSLQPWAAGLREMVAPSGIVISEMYRDRMFDDLAPAELAEVLSWFACDVDRRRYNSLGLPANLRTLRAMAILATGRVVSLEERHGIRLAQGPSNWFYGVALAWCAGGSIQSIAPGIEIGEGDIVSTLNKTIDLLDQFRGLLVRAGDYETLSRVAQARKLLNRGMVAMLRSDGVIEPAKDGVDAPLQLALPIG
jgi:superfamily II RNA helicase